MSDITKEIRERLFALQDLKYRDFQKKLIPSVDEKTVIGVRTPALRKLAGEYARRPEAEEFLLELPHTYYEENNLHGFILEKRKDFEQCVAEVDAFLPYVDNWSTCDTMSPKVFKKHLPELLPWIRTWIASDRTYTIRYGIGMLMQHYLDEAFDEEYPGLVASVRSEEYYVRMMIAWYFATALAKQYDAALPYVEQNRLDVWTHNKTIQKAVESYRITDEQKAYLRTLRRK